MTTINTARMMALSGATADDIDNWIRRLPLSTGFGPVGRGRARAFTRDNALEICFLAHLVKKGFTATSAAEHAASLVRSTHKQENEGGYRVVLLYDSEGAAKAAFADIDNPLPRLLVEGLVIAVAIHQFIDRVDAAFAEAAA